MNPFIKEELNKIRVAKLPEYDNNTTHIFIPKTIRREDVTILPNTWYIIELEDYLLHPSDNFTLHDNWNNGIIPMYKYMRCYVETILGKMIKIQGIAVDMKTMQDIDYKWSGWLPKKSIDIIKELK